MVSHPRYAMLAVPPLLSRRQVLLHRCNKLPYCPTCPHSIVFEGSMTISRISGGSRTARAEGRNRSIGSCRQKNKHFAAVKKSLCFLRSVHMAKTLHFYMLCCLWLYTCVEAAGGCRLPCNCAGQVFEATPLATQQQSLLMLLASRCTRQLSDSPVVHL